MENGAFIIRDDTVFVTDGLRGVANHKFHVKNLLIGKNGSGKTRFLKVLEKYYLQTESEAQVVTLYFPEIRATYTPIEFPIGEDNVSLYDATYSGVILTFQDYLKLVEQDGVSFLEDIYRSLDIHARQAKQKRLKDLQKLNEFLSQLLGRTLLEEKESGQIIVAQRTENARNLSLEECLKELSPGELMLFYLSTFLFYLSHVSNGNRKIILLMDEPEIHLHPKALLSMLNMLYDCDAISQFWIASHSIFILPQFPFEDLVYMHEGEVLKLGSTTYHNIYNDLIGLENIDMYELLGSIENWENYQFVVENFLLPQTKGNASAKDEQMLKFLEVLRDAQGERPLNVLDYGAGQCRMWECLKLAVPDSEIRNSLLCYRAYDPIPPKDYPKDITYDIDEGEARNRGKCDIVVLMNVLHEIEPEQWCEVFHSIHGLLEENGILVFLEVLSLTNGEQPYGQAGFLLLRDKQVMELFPDAYNKPLPNNSTAEKSHCWVIPAKSLISIKPQMIPKIISSLEKSCEDLLIEIDKERVEMAHCGFEQAGMAERKRTARQYAFLAQQFINAHIAYQRLTGEGRDQTLSTSEKKKQKKIDYPGLKERRAASTVKGESIKL